MSAGKQEDEGFWGGLGRMFRGGVEKSKRLGRLGLLKIDLQKIKGERTTLYEQIGRLTVKRVRDSADKRLDASDQALKHLLEELAEIEQRIEQTLQEIEQLRQGGE